jgi:hypothetical protein
VHRTSNLEKHTNEERRSERRRYRAIKEERASERVRTTISSEHVDRVLINL